MSLFEDSNYIYRDTFFVYFDNSKRPSAADVLKTLDALGKGYASSGMVEAESFLKQVTVKSDRDFSAMDITYVDGEEVSLAITELMETFKTITLVGDDQAKLSKFMSCNARFDIFHFEKVAEGGQEEFLDPGGLLVVLEALANLCDGVSLDPQSYTLL